MVCGSTGCLYNIKPDLDVLKDNNYYVTKMAEDENVEISDLGFCGEVWELLGTFLSHDILLCLHFLCQYNHH